MKKILAFAGSNSSQSINHQFLKALTPHFQLNYELISLRDYEAPLFGIDLKNEKGVPESMQELHKKMLDADGFVLSAAEHNGSMAAVLKNTFDWLSMLEKKFFLHKPTMILGASPGPRGAASSRGHLVDILPYRGAEIIGNMGLPNFSDNYKDGVIEQNILDQIIPLIRTLEETINQES